MSLVYGGVAKDNMGKTVPYYIDTDDLTMQSITT